MESKHSCLTCFVVWQLMCAGTPCKNYGALKCLTLLQRVKKAPEFVLIYLLLDPLLHPGLFVHPTLGVVIKMCLDTNNLPSLNNKLKKMYVL